MEEDLPDFFDFNIKKKKKKDEISSISTIEEEGINIKSGEKNKTPVLNTFLPDVNVSFVNDESKTLETFEYSEMLARVYGILDSNDKKCLSDSKVFKIVPPNVMKVGSKKTAISNISEISIKLNRNIDHLSNFFFSELTTTGSIDGNNQLIIKGRYNQIQMESILRKYILEFVTCGNCKSPNTELSKELRLTFINCKNCGSKRTVNNVKILCKKVVPGRGTSELCSGEF